MGIAGSGERDDDLARAYVERLEAALAAAAHKRDLAGERARLAGEGVEQLEQRVAALRRQRDRERDEAERELERHALEAERERERDLAKARKRLEAREEHLANAKAGIEARDRRLEVVSEKLEAREAELHAQQEELDAAGTLLEAQGTELARAGEAAQDAARERDEARGQAREATAGIEARDRRLEVAERTGEGREAELASRDVELRCLRAADCDRERKLALVEARLEKARQRAEYFEGSLVEIRSGRAYRLMRILWRLRRPFRRAPREGTTADSASEGEPDPRTVADPPPPPEPPASAPPRLATSSRRPGEERQGGERLRVASILDEMSAACFAPECDLVPLTLDGWAGQLDEHRPDLLLVESAWNGNDGEWQYRIARYPRKDLVGLPALRALLEGCRERGIPTAFWNKEDPVHFERFAEAAAFFDHVFTTDARCVERYRALPEGERTVTSLPFAAQPRIHNPAAAVAARSASPCFAGAWYRDRHPERRAALEALLDAARPYGLVIYDRSFGGDDGAFGFPERFAPHVLGGLPYERILDVYRSHRVFLNANSVVDSPTMCSRRVFELAACDTAILSTPGAALTALLGEGMVDEAGDEEAAVAALERLLGDEAERRRRTRAARRKVFAAHTYADRLATIAETVGVDVSSLRRKPFASPGPSANGASAPPNGSGDVHPWLLALQPGIALSEQALADLAAAATFAEADVIGASPAHNGDAAIEHRHVSDLDPRALLVRRELVESRGRLAGSPEQVSAKLRQWRDEEVRLYAADADLLSPRESRPTASGLR